METIVAKPPRSSKWFFGVITFAVIMMGATFLYLQKPRTGKTVRLNLVEIRNMRGNKPVYPYSVVPGGVHSGADVRQAMAQDSSVNDHYEGVKTGEIQPAVLKSDLLAYVSYKKHGRIYWTKNPLRIEAGEAVLDDARQYIRARCGNRISLIAQMPVITPESEEPDAPEFDTPETLPLKSSGTSAPNIHSPPTSDFVHGQSTYTGSTTTGPVLTGSGSGRGSGAGLATGGGGQPAGTADRMDAIVSTDSMPSTELNAGQVIAFGRPVTELVPAALQPDFIFALIPREPGERFPRPHGHVDVRRFDNQFLPIPFVPIEVIVEKILPEPQLPGNNIPGQVVEALLPEDLPIIPPIPEPQTYGIVGGGLTLILLWAKRYASLRTGRTSP